MGNLRFDRDYERRFVQRHQAMVLQALPNVCWLWQGSLTGNGYGKMRGHHGHYSDIGIRGFYQAHRIALAIHTCPVAWTVFQFIDQYSNWAGGVSDLEAAHSCHTRPCCNPAHLAWKTHKQNIADVVKVHGGIGRNAHDRGRRVT